MSAPLRIAVLPGDGIGPEVTREAVRVLEAAARAHGIGLETIACDFGACALRRGVPALPPETVAPGTAWENCSTAMI